jgi:tetratricopeptide (TPR) repeat protein
MADQDYQQTSEYLITRRTALATLATLSTRLLTRVQGGPLSPIVVEEFLRESTTAITACWELLNANGLATVEYALPRYLPLLMNLAHQPSKYQQQAAYLASQGCLLMNFVTYHQFRFHELLAYATQSVELAVISTDTNLHVKALGWLGGAFEQNGQAQMLLEKRQYAAFHLKKILQPLQSKVLSELAYAYAQNGRTEDAQRSLKEAQQLLPDTIGEVPCFISSDYGMLQLILEEGKTHIALSQHDTDHVLEHSMQAQTALAQLGKLPSTISVPERTKIEIINHQAAAAVGAGNMEEFIHYLQAGAKGAKALGSQKRKQEAIANWKAARVRWPHEKQIWELADILME